MALPVVAVVGIGALLASFGRWLLTSLGILIANLLMSLVGKAILGSVIVLVLGYFASTKIDAVGWLLDYIGTLDPATGNLAISGIGTLVQAIRLDDIILVYINAYVSAWILRTMLSLGVFKRGGTMQA